MVVRSLITAALVVGSLCCAAAAQTGPMAPREVDSRGAPKMGPLVEPDVPGRTPILPKFVSRWLKPRAAELDERRAPSPPPRATVEAVPQRPGLLHAQAPGHRPVEGPPPDENLRDFQNSNRLSERGLPPVGSAERGLRPIRGEAEPPRRLPAAVLQAAGQSVAGTAASATGSETYTFQPHTAGWSADVRGRVLTAAAEVDAGPFDPAPMVPVPPAPAREGPLIRIPVLETDLDRVEIAGSDDRISLTVRDAPLSSVLGLIAQQHKLNVVTSDEVTGNITVTLSDVRLDDALNAILAVNGYTWVRQNNIILISRLAGERRVAPAIQGRLTRVFDLNYVSAADVDKVVRGLLSPSGQSFVTDSDPLDKRRTRERIVVEDVPEYVQRIEAYVFQVDQPPRQVLIEARVYQVTLRDDSRGGVNFEQLSQLAGANIALRTQGFGAATAGSPAFFLGLDSTDLNALSDVLEDTTDAKTLANPKVLVVNAQEARIQIGEQLGYLVTTTTQTSTLQNVDFIDLGVVLRVTPIIGDDNQVLMHVKPEVSSGRINPVTGLPEEATTEVESTILLPSGCGMVIGGLIKETDSDNQSKIPIVGDLWMVGRLFQRRQAVRERTEIIITLIPHILPYPPELHCRDEADLARAATPLFLNGLDNSHRIGLEPQIADAFDNPRRLRWERIPDSVFGVFEEYPRPPSYYFPSPGEGAVLPVSESPGAIDRHVPWPAPDNGRPPGRSASPELPPPPPPREPLPASG